MFGDDNFYLDFKRSDKIKVVAGGVELFRFEKGELTMQHMDEPLKRYDMQLISCAKCVMEESNVGTYVKYEDVKEFLEIIAKKVRLI